MDMIFSSENWDRGEKMAEIHTIEISGGNKKVKSKSSDREGVFRSSNRHHSSKTRSCGLRRNWRTFAFFKGNIIYAHISFEKCKCPPTSPEATGASFWAMISILTHTLRILNFCCRQKFLPVKFLAKQYHLKNLLFLGNHVTLECCWYEFPECCR